MDFSGTTSYFLSELGEIDRMGHRWTRIWCKMSRILWTKMKRCRYWLFKWSLLPIMEKDILTFSKLSASDYFHTYYFINLGRILCTAILPCSKHMATWFPYSLGSNDISSRPRIDCSFHKFVFVKTHFTF